MASANTSSGGPATAPSTGSSSERERYDRLAPGPDGVFRSEVFPGLWLDAGAMIRGDRRAVNAILRQGLASPEHAAFVAS